MSKDDVPEWAMREFCNRANLDYGAVMYGRDMVALRSVARAGGRLIAAHEQPPVDPLREVIKAAYEAYDCRVPRVPPSTHFLDTMTAELRARGVTVTTNAGGCPSSADAQE